MPYVDLLPYGDARGRSRAVEVAGRRFRVHPGLEPAAASAARRRARCACAIADVTKPPAPDAAARAASASCASRACAASEALRPPVAGRARAARRDLARTSLTYLFERTTRRRPVRGAAARDRRRRRRRCVRDRGDAERGLERAVRAAGRAALERGRVGDASRREAPDDALDRLAGLRGGRRPRRRASRACRRCRASSAFDGDPRDRVDRRLGERARVDRLARARPRDGARAALVDAPVRVRRAVRVRLRADGRAGPALTVGPRGRVALPAPVRGRDFRLDIVAAAFPPGTRGRERQRRAVGIAEVRGAGVALRAAPGGTAARGVRRPAARRRPPVALRPAARARPRRPRAAARPRVRRAACRCARGRPA